MVLDMGSGLRERRKQETRQAISDIATLMFVDRGFDEVTIAAIADAAGVSKMTVTNHFPRKEDLVFDRVEEAVRDLGPLGSRCPVPVPQRLASGLPRGSGAALLSCC